MIQIRYYGLLTLLCLCLYLPGLARLPLFDRDEPHFAEASRQMAATGDYWRIYFQYQPRRLKPPGIYWLQTTAVKIFSHPESTAAWPYRLPSAVGAWLAVLLTFSLARNLTSLKTALLSAVFLACSLLLMVQAHLAITDALLLATMTIMQWALAMIYLSNHRRSKLGRQWPCLFWVAMAAGVFIKGITPLVAGLTILGICFTDQEKGWLKGLGWRWGIPLLLLLTAGWLIPFSIASGQNFLWDMIRGDVLPKLAGGQQSHGMPPGYFIGIFTAAFWPASLFIVPAAIWSWRKRREPAVLFLLAWILPVWIFFELVPTKLPEYVLPTFPAIAVLIALSLRTCSKSPRMSQNSSIFEHRSAVDMQVNEHRSTENRRIMASLGDFEQALKRDEQPPPRWATVLWRVQQGLWAVWTLALAIVLIYSGGVWNWIAGFMMISAGGYLLFNHSNAIGAMIVMMALAFIPLWQFTLPSINSAWISPRVSAFISKTAPEWVNDQHPLLSIDYHEPSLVFYMGKHRVTQTNSFQAIQAAQRQPHALILVSTKSLACFSELAQAGSLGWRYMGKIHGFQYNRSHSINLYLFLTSRKLYGQATYFDQAGFLGALVRGGDPLLLFCGSARDDFFI